jgi:hypothetical protein
MKPLSEVAPGLLVIHIPIQAVCIGSMAAMFQSEY